MRTDKECLECTWVKSCGEYTIKGSLICSMNKSLERLEKAEMKRKMQEGSADNGRG